MSTIPYVIEQTSRGERSYDIFSRLLSDHIQKSKQRLNRILSENTGKPIENIMIDTERDNYMSAKQALDYGLIDKIIDKR